MGKRAKVTRPFSYAEGQNPMDIYLSGLGEDSQRTMGSALESIADILSDGKIAGDQLPWHKLRSPEVNYLRGRLQKYYAPATANRYLSALRAVLKEAWRANLVDRETMERTMDVRSIKGSRELSGRAITVDDLRAVFEACASDENGALGARDAAILALLYGAGLRRAEAAALHTEDVSLPEGSIVVRGKGNKERTVFLPKGTVQALKAWIEVRGGSSGAFFARVKKSGEVELKGVSPQLIYLVVEKRHREAGVEAFTPHDLRRSFISELLDDGIDLSTVAKQVGHSNVQTTARYDRRGTQAQMRAATRMKVPFKG